MAEVKRYDLEWLGDPYSEYQAFVERPDGDWVEFSEVESKIAALERRLRDLCDRYRELQAREVTTHDFECCIISAENFLESKVESEQKEQEERGER